eukprot:m.136880 g.136880  ORF g.136880 m.136880 type:complete len:618 (-) comp11035_c0_seq1:132-1985(-)
MMTFFFVIVVLVGILDMMLPCDGEFVLYPNVNAVPQASTSCNNNNPPFVCLGTTETYMDCQTMCLASNTTTCYLWTWSPTTHHCWTRADNSWLAESWNGYYSACDNSTVPDCAPNAFKVQATYNTDRLLGHMDMLSPAVTFDFWLKNDTVYGNKWETSGILQVDLTDSALMYYASELSPSLLRIGGSPEDSIFFDATGGCVPGGSGPSSSYYCSQVRPYIYGCLHPSRWMEILEFVQRTGLKLTIGLNVCYGRTSPTSSMDFSNIRALLNFTIASGLADQIAFFEFGNEVTHASPTSTSGLTPLQWVSDVSGLAELIHTMYTAAGLTPPPVAGPDDYDLNGYIEIVKTMKNMSMTPDRFLALTYHQYPQCLPGASLVLEPSCLESLASTAKAMASLTNDTPFRMFAGETADHSGGGVLGVTNTFTSSFYYAYQLGALPSNNITLAARQCLMGGYYELLNKTTLIPNPDFYIAWLTRNLINKYVPGKENSTPLARAIEVKVDFDVSTSGLQVFAFVNTEGVPVVMAINLNRDKDVDLTVYHYAPPPSPPDSNRMTFGNCEYHLRGDVDSNRVTLNGNPLVTTKGEKLPQLDSIAIHSTSVITTVQSSSIAYIVYGCLW